MDSSLSAEKPFRPARGKLRDECHHETHLRTSIVGSKIVCYTKIKTSAEKNPRKRATMSHLMRFKSFYGGIFIHF